MEVVRPATGRHLNGSFSKSGSETVPLLDMRPAWRHMLAGLNWRLEKRLRRRIPRISLTLRHWSRSRWG